MTTLAVLLTVHNRKEKTLAALRSLFAQERLPSELIISVFMVDDGSTDGTSLAIQANFPQVKIIQGNGNLFWNQGMRLAFSHALKIGFSHYLWLNDDTELYLTTLQQLLILSSQFEEQAIIVGSLRDPSNDSLTYGGVKRTNRFRPLNFTLVLPEDKPVAVETMNGNCVLIPQKVAMEVGNLDQAFLHGLGDYDYGLRALKLGYSIHLAPGYVGTCPRENKQGIINKSFNAQWKFMQSPKGLPLYEWEIFARRYAGRFWFLYWLSPYIKFILGKHL